MAEEIGTIGEIGAWVLRRACAEAAGWPSGDDGTFPGIAVNVSGRELADPGYTDRVEAALADSGLDPSRLVLEITETAVIDDAPVAAARLHQLKALGVRVAVDDFGTGCSSFSYLRQLPIDILKIDRSFIDAVGGDGPLPAIVRGLVDLGHTLDMELVAEGIERPEQRLGLAAGGCGMGQGYLFARPLDPQDVRTLLAGDGSDVRAPAPV